MLHSSNGENSRESSETEKLHKGIMQYLWRKNLVLDDNEWCDMNELSLKLMGTTTGDIVSALFLEDSDLEVRPLGHNNYITRLTIASIERLHQEDPSCKTNLLHEAITEYILQRHSDGVLDEYELCELDWLSTIRARLRVTWHDVVNALFSNKSWMSYRTYAYK